MKKEKLFFILAFATVGILAGSIMVPFASYIVLAGILTYTLFPVYTFISERSGHPQVSSALCIVFTLIAIILPSIYIISELVAQVSGAYNSFQAANLDRIGDYLSGMTGNRMNFRELLDSTFDQVRRSIVSMVPDLLGSATDLTLGLFVMFFVMFYAFREGAGFLNRIQEILPLEPGLKHDLFFELRTVTQAVLYGQVMTAVIQGSLGGLMLLAFGVPNWIFWGVVMILLSFLPMLGTPLIWIPAAVAKFIDGEMGNGIGLLLVGSTIVMNVDNFIRPRLVSGRTHVHPVLILIGVLGGLKVFGFVGMLVGPLILALMVAFVKFYEVQYQRQPHESAAD